MARASAEYDPQADALYVRVSEGARARTVECDERHYVDLDDEGAPVGFEVLYPRMGVRLAALTRAWPIPADEVANAIKTAIGESIPMTATAAVDAYGVAATFSTPSSAGAPGASCSRSLPPELLVG
jgi:uncharacterized protein YuzE